MTCRCPHCLWSPREPNEMLRLATDLEETNSVEAYRRMRRTTPSAAVADHSAPWAVAQPVTGPPAGPGMPSAGGDGLPPDPRAPGSGEPDIDVPSGGPRPVPLSVFRLIRRWLP